MMAVDVQTAPAFRALKPKNLFEGRYVNLYFDVSPDGQRFLMVKPAEARPTELHFVVNWFEELRRLAPAK